MQPHKEAFNDGFLQYGYTKSQRSESGKKTGDIFTTEGKLAFREMSARESDYQLAGAMGAKLDLKVKTLYPPSFRNIKKSKLKVRINGIEFDVIKVDSDNANQFLFFMLQEVGDYTE
ncbi:phage head closure protein [Schinkia azotoformans]|uniref:phage head closure protein n=1 Tax=Schinkia azotoformans TaxID=1454 RepID=UPI002DBF00A6|nr:phage head closure protein [Schinkia azotoformans]MEC1778404.1 phage head closure protein [Schinkia azotoformans]MED4328351.1 phage head closure protein [Schinkia azotoformans]